MIKATSSFARKAQDMAYYKLDAGSYETMYLMFIMQQIAIRQ